MIQTDISTTNSVHPQQVQSGKLERVSHIERCLRTLTEFLDPHLPFANTNVTDFITDGQWESYLPTKIQDELSQLSDDQLQKLPHLNGDKTNTSGTYLSSTSENEKIAKILGNSSQWNHESLNDFLQDANCCSLEHLNVLTEISDLKGKLDLNLDTNLFLPTFMSEKKSHEVVVMSKLCNALCQHFDIKTVVDLGSGKGYLGVQLADNYDLQVIGIDASTIHTLGAKKRASILKKQQPKSFQNKPQKVSKTEHSSSDRADLSTEDGQNQTDQSDHHKDGHDKTDQSTADENISENSINQSENSALNQENSEKGFYLPTAAFVDNNTDIVELLSSKIDVSHLNGKLQVLVTGLHTCGNLCPTALQFFSGNPTASVLCNVACCYHLLDEGNDYTDMSPEIMNSFPMSSFLRRKKFQLGRGARNLASQSISRNMSSGQLQGNSLFQRALLQKIIQDTVDPDFHKPNSPSKLRKLGSKCSTFLEYVRKAFIRLGFPHDHICDQLISDFLTKYEGEKKRLAAFFQLKTVLAPSIEAVIILDRLHFLLEQDAVSDAYICQLFNP